ncbi:hypothetical protein [Roseivirga misakiensis]|uniref:Uncharacterized protein n=1 Tax=Roseivirga misakiensis TaxID=1563681 RepID=A0A1E5T5R8_9BACT|nr:hypothetical protein [Roseivirga misakiensis]OEK06715.1 hypothetical protein BFP71_03370 [Roseivirga misakiensis]
MGGSEKKEFIQFDITGKNEALWHSLSKRLETIVQDIVAKVSNNSASPAITKEILALGVDFVKAKAQKPTLENEKLKAEITERYSQVHKNMAETELHTEEALSKKIDNLEKMIRLMFLLKGGPTHFLQDNNEANLLFGVDLNQLTDKRPDYSDEDPHTSEGKD